MKAKPHFYLLAIGLQGCKIDPDRVADHDLYTTHGNTVDAAGRVSFAVVGNTRSSLSIADRQAGRFHHEGVSEAIIAHIGDSLDENGPSFVVFNGDMVPFGRPGPWEDWSSRWASVLEGYEMPTGPEAETALNRIPSIPVVGNAEARFDRRYRGVEATFPGAGAPIGFNRVGSWQAFDIATDGHVWRLMMLDSNRSTLGSRWNEQLAWIPRALEGEYDGLLVFMHEPLYDLGGRDFEMNRDDAPEELLQLIEDSTSLASLVAVVTAGHHTSQALLPDGPFGPLHIGAGGGGAPAEDLRRWGPPTGTSRVPDIVLEPQFDMALQEALTEWNEETTLPEIVVDEARARNSYEGFRGNYVAAHFPVYGWWELQVDQEGVRAIFWHYSPGPRLEAIYMANYTELDGWSTDNF